jgi:hypothetical protein
MRKLSSASGCIVSMPRVPHSHQTLETDACRFTGDGINDVRNWHKWAEDNLHTVRHGHNKHPFPMKVWARIIKCRITMVLVPTGGVSVDIYLTTFLCTLDTRRSLYAIVFQCVSVWLYGSCYVDITPDFGSVGAPGFQRHAEHGIEARNPTDFYLRVSVAKGTLYFKVADTREPHWQHIRSTANT